MPGVQRRVKNERRSSAAAWAMGIMGLYEYDGDPPGVKRIWFGNDAECQWHHGHHMPAFPLEGDNNIWMFRKSDDVSSNSWTITESGAGTQLALIDERGGVAKAILGGSNDNYQYYFSKSEIAKIESAGSVIFNAQIRVKDVDQADMFVGLCQKLASGNLFDNRVESAGFFLADGGAGLGVETRLAGTELQSLNQQYIEDEIFYSLGMNICSTPEWSRKAVNFFIDGVYKTTHITQIPTEEMCFVFGLRNGEASANEISIKTSYILQT